MQKSTGHADYNAAYWKHDAVSSLQNATGLFLQDASHRLLRNKALLYGRTLLDCDFKACFTDIPRDYSISRHDRFTLLHKDG